MELGTLKPPYPVEHCASSTCKVELAGRPVAFTFLDTATGKCVVMCGDCALWVELMHADRFWAINLTAAESAQWVIE